MNWYIPKLKELRKRGEDQTLPPMDRIKAYCELYDLVRFDDRERAIAVRAIQEIANSYAS